MKIIRQGNLEAAQAKKRATRRFTCKECDCVFDADKGEYVHEAMYNEDSYRAPCPTCGAAVWDSFAMASDGGLSNMDDGNLRLGSGADMCIIRADGIVNRVLTIDEVLNLPEGMRIWVEQNGGLMSQPKAQWREKRDGRLSTVGLTAPWHFYIDPNHPSNADRATWQWRAWMYKPTPEEEALNSKWTHDGRGASQSLDASKLADKVYADHKLDKYIANAGPIPADGIASHELSRHVEAKEQTHGHADEPMY